MLNNQQSQKNVPSTIYKFGLREASSKNRKREEGKKTPDDELLPICINVLMYYGEDRAVAEFTCLPFHHFPKDISASHRKANGKASRRSKKKKKKQEEEEEERRMKEKNTPPKHLL